jgi:hypothetical protein
VVGNLTMAVAPSAIFDSQKPMSVALLTKSALLSLTTHFFEHLT